jgi:membrane protein DedA with SNARE-associated domain
VQAGQTEVIVDPLGHLIAWCAEYGWAGLFVVALLERLVLVIPSYGLLVTIGIGSASGFWPIPVVWLTTVAGSFLGAAACYICAASVGAERSIAFLVRFARLLGVSPARMEKLVSDFRDNQPMLLLGAQLVPTVRLVAPAIAGFLGADAKSFALASGCGIVIWNSLFLAVGYAAKTLAVTDNASALALQVLLLLMAGEGLAFLLWRRSCTPSSRPSDDPAE